MIIKSGRLPETLNPIVGPKKTKNYDTHEKLQKMGKIGKCANNAQIPIKNLYDKH